MRKCSALGLVLLFLFALVGMSLAATKAHALSSCNGRLGGSRCGYELVACKQCGNVGCQHVNCVYAKAGDKFCCTNGWKADNGWCSKCGNMSYRHLN
jgi:hypothetical protein